MIYCFFFLSHFVGCGTWVSFAIFAKSSLNMTNMPTASLNPAVQTPIRAVQRPAGAGVSISGAVLPLSAGADVVEPIPRGAKFRQMLVSQPQSLS